MLSQQEYDKLLQSCRNLPPTDVITEESHVFEDAVLILMSTVLSLNRRWYAAALPARSRFEAGPYLSAPKGSLVWLKGFMEGHGAAASAERDDWLDVAQGLWRNREWTKARALWNLNNYLLEWMAALPEGQSDIMNLRSWGAHVTVDQFLGKVSGLAQRAFEQLQWYLEGVTAIKLDVHVTAFVYEAVGRRPSDNETKDALTRASAVLGVSPTELDARVWDYMQSRVRAP